MGDDLRYRPSRSVAPLMAAAFVLLMGTAFCVALLFAFDGGSPIPVAIAIGSSTSIGVLIWLLRDRPDTGKRNWFAWVSRRGQDAEQSMYRVAVIRHKQALGNKRPPTLDELRDLKDPTRTWVPHGGRGGDPAESSSE